MAGGFGNENFCTSEGNITMIIIDRIEGEFAVVELPDGRMVDMPKELLPVGANEGDVIEIRINRDERARRQKRIEELMNDLWE